MVLALLYSPHYRELLRLLLRSVFAALLWLRTRLTLDFGLSGLELRLEIKNVKSTERRFDLLKSQCNKK